jgi:hypothetical protein
MESFLDQHMVVSINGGTINQWLLDVVGTKIIYVGMIGGTPYLWKPPYNLRTTVNLRIPIDIY